ncbi:MAG: hypothetical protein ABW124_14870 [Candidatus Thiodiazotropha sp. 6PLUC9]
MPRKRNYRDEYQRRIASGLARGLSRSQASGHPKAGEPLVRPTKSEPDPRLDDALLSMNRGQSLTSTAKSHHVSANRLSRYLSEHGLAELKGRRWIPTDSRPRQIQVMTKGVMKVLTIVGFKQASLIGEHHYAAGRFVRTNDIEWLHPFEGQYVRDINGRKYPLETDPNAIHRIASMDDPPFHEIYEITSNT